MSTRVTLVVPMLAALLLVTGGCTTSYRSPAESETLVKTLPNHPTVRVYGVDGSVLHGELLNGTITIDSGQGQLVLLTDHIHTIDFAADGDTVDSDSVKMNGTIRDTAFLLRNEHGVFTLLKERLKQVEFVNGPNAAGTEGSTATDGYAPPARSRPSTSTTYGD
jgi:hypothetical protein